MLGVVEGKEHLALNLIEKFKLVEVLEVFAVEGLDRELLYVLELRVLVFLHVEVYFLQVDVADVLRVHDP